MAQDKVNDVTNRGEAAVDKAKYETSAAVHDVAARGQAASAAAKPSVDAAAGHAGEAIDQMKDAAASATGPVKDTAAQAVQGAASSAQDAVGTLSDQAQDLAARGAAAAGQIRDQIPSADEMRAAGRRGSEQIARQVARQPFEALLLAGAVGYLAAWIIHRR